jgi:hypothetical protein
VKNPITRTINKIAEEIRRINFCLRINILADF